MNIRERILARRDLDSMRANRDITGLAAALNASPPYEPHETMITSRGVVTLHKDEGRDIMQRLQVAATQDICVEVAVLFLGQEAGLDIGDPDSWRELDLLVDRGCLTEAQGALLKSLSLKPVLVTQEEVALEMYHPDGAEK